MCSTGFEVTNYIKQDSSYFSVRIIRVNEYGKVSLKNRKKGQVEKDEYIRVSKIPTTRFLIENCQNTHFFYENLTTSGSISVSGYLL